MRRRLPVIPEARQSPRPRSPSAQRSRRTASGLRSATLRSAPRPSLLAAPLTSLRGAGPGWRRRRPSSGSSPSASCCSTSRTPTGTAPQPRQLSELGIGEQATVEVEVRSAPAADPPSRPGDRRGDGGGRVGPGKAVWFNQAWLAERLQRGDAAAAVREARPRRISGRGARVPAGGRGRRRSPTRASTRRASSRSIPRRSGCAPSGCASGHGRRGRWPATRSSRCRRSFAPAAAGGRR